MDSKNINYILTAICVALLITLGILIYSHDGISYKDRLKQEKAEWIKQQAKDSIKIVAKYEIKLQEKDEKLAKLDSITTSNIQKTNIKYVQIIKSIPLWSDDSLVGVVRNRYDKNLYY